jgi:DNA-binding LytR/AlgR family response regulator
MIRIAIVDDDADDLKLLQSNIERFFRSTGGEYGLFAFSDGEDLLYRYDRSYDVIFLDVEMRWSIGIDVARAIREKDRDTLILFVSRIAQYAVQGYSVDAMDYLLKPVEYGSFEPKLRRAIGYAQSHRSSKIQINVGGDYRWISTDAIRHVEVYGHSLVYHTAEGDLRSAGAIAAVAEKLEPCHFIQCTRFSLVNLKYVTGIEGNDLILGAEKIPISRRRRKEIVDALLDYNGGRL